MLTKTAVCIDPIIYFGLNPQFRSEMLLWLGLSSSKNDEHSCQSTVLASLSDWRRRYVDDDDKEDTDEIIDNAVMMMTTITITMLCVQISITIFYFRKVSAEHGTEETDTTCQYVVNTSMDMSTMSDTMDTVKEEKSRSRVKISPLAVQSGSLLVERSKRGEDTVEIIVEEGKVVFTHHDGKEEEPLL